MREIRVRWSLIQRSPDHPLFDAREDAVEFVESVVVDDELALALAAVLELDARAYFFGEVCFVTTDVRGDRLRGCGLLGGLREQTAHQAFGFAHRYALRHFLARGRALRRALQRQQRTCVAHLQFAPLHHAFELVVELQQAQQIRDRRTRAPHGLGDRRWVRVNSPISRCKALASSMGFRFSRWMFSISAIAIAALSGTSRTTAGISCRPAICAARQRRSPAMISYSPLPSGFSTMGCTTPCARMDAARSSRLSVCMSTRGWYLPRRIRSTGRLRSPESRGAAAGADEGTGAAGSMLPSKASRPRPRPRFLITIFIIR